MARFCTLFSGSSGNASYVGTADGGILIDAGVSCRSLLGALRDREIDPQQIQGIFITHEHTDHIKALPVLLKKLHTTLYASAPTLGWLLEREMIPPSTPLQAVEDGPVLLGNLQVTAFPTPHDAVGSMGYRVETGDGRKIGVATDLGWVTPQVQAGIQGCDLVLLESNYDPAMLRCSRYPYSLKRRISSQQGHLSNEDCADQVCKLLSGGSTRFVLGHLSQENNLPQLARETIRSALTMTGAREGIDYTLTVAPRTQPGEMVLL